MLNLEKSAEAFAEAKNLMPGGVNSPVRSYRGMSCPPPFIARAEGSHIYDGDLIYVRCQSEVQSGSIAVVMIGDEVTVKKVKYKNDSENQRRG